MQSTNSTDSSTPANPPPDAPDSAPAATPAGTRRHAFLIGAGILLSRVAGLVRDRVFAHYFGNSDAADAFRAAFRIPNLLQNLFGEGVLSASFIPVYARLLAGKKDDEARKTAGAVAALLMLSTTLLVLLGVLGTPWLIYVIAAGFHGEKRDLTILLVRILFPGAGLLVASAWCLGVLNSHRKFFLSYTAPVLWNFAMIAGMIGFGRGASQNSHVVTTAWASVAGSLLQVGVQLPMVLKLLGGLKLSLGRASEHVQTVVRNFVPVFISRGVVQISAYVDAFIASWLPTGAVAALSYAQTLYTLPVSLFGMSVSAAELPMMSGALGAAEEVAGILRTRLNAGLRQITFLVVPSVAGFLLLGDVIVAAIYQSGKFTHTDTTYVWGILAGSTVGLLASTLGRLYSSTFYALRDTRTPLRFAIARVALTTVLGLRLRTSTAAPSRHRATLGRRRPDDLRRHRLLGGVRPAAARHPGADRSGWRAARVSGAHLDRRFAGRRRWARRGVRDRRTRAHPGRDCGSRNVWRCVLRRLPGDEVARSAVDAGSGRSPIEAVGRGGTPPLFLDVWQTKDFKSFRFGSVATKGVRGRFFRMCGKQRSYG